MLENWTNIFIYHIKNNKLFTALNVLGLSIGIAGLIFSILYWNEEHSYNQWNPAKNHVFATSISLDNIKFYGSAVSALGPSFKKSIPEIDSYCYVNPLYNSGVIEYKGKKILSEKIIDSQNNFFSYFPFHFISGSATNALKDAESIVISIETSKKLFGNENPLNKQVFYNKTFFTVKGIYKITGKSSFEPSAVINQIDSNLKQEEDNWSVFQFGLLIKLKNPKDAEKVRTKIENLYYKNKTIHDAKVMGISVEKFIERYGNINVLIESIKDLHFTKADGFPEEKGNFQFLAIACSLSILILILSIVNYINLATANAIKRAKEESTSNPSFTKKKGK